MLADHTKLGIDTMVQTVPVDRMAHVVTDEAADLEVVQALRAAGVAVHVAHYAPSPAPDGADPTV
ncbi:hypothetical protein [Lapillicoccus sp.]|uniref:hypothetical protein n=1 Tax=Lapillicoccus sp. TaxID=1909287 RepID=UPI0032668218